MKIVIIGGVAAGASAGARARRLNEPADIVILERGEHVSFANCGLPYHIGGVITERERLLLQTPQSLKESLNLDVRTGHEVLAIHRARRTVSVVDRNSGRSYEESYDKLMLCPGAVPLRPALPGADHPRIRTLRNIADMDAIQTIIQAGARQAVVIGGGYIGVEMAETLRARGLNVDLVEMTDQILPPLDVEMTRELESHLALHGVRLHLGRRATAFRDREGRVEVVLTERSLPAADLVILAAGVRPDTRLAADAGLDLGARGGIRVDAHLRTSDPDIYAAGDAVEVRDRITGECAQVPLAGPANRQGRVAADHVCGRSSTYAGTQGTAIVKVFDMTAGATGATEKRLVAAGIPYAKVYLHPSGHASYYPGTAPMHIKLIFAPDTGRLLGAQVVGRDGVDKRLDVFATAIHGGMTVFDLEDLELAYAPPYGSARDPVNMAGFVAANVVRGDIELWYPGDYPEQTNGGLIVDVRSRNEFDAGHIPGAVHLPLGRLRASRDRIPTHQPIFLYCRVGFRSYLAYRMLKQSGFQQVKTLSGGLLTFRAWHGENA